MSLQEQFAEAQMKAKAFKKAPTTDELLQLYSLYKQATVGDATGSRPGMLDLKGRAKFDAWTKVKGTGKDDAMQKYVAFVNLLTKTLG